MVPVLTRVKHCQPLTPHHTPPVERARVCGLLVVNHIVNANTTL